MALKNDYQELIDELKDELSNGSLSKHEVIQILRATQSDKDGYYPIIDWYYNKEVMAIELAPEDSDQKDDIKEKMIIREQYQKDETLLNDMTVDDCLAEMIAKTPKQTKQNRNPFF